MTKDENTIATAFKRETMTQAEKAKAYDKAIGKAQDIFHTSEFVKITDLFPELAESEDDRIRKTLSVLVQNAIYPGLITEEDSKKCLAYLEKQKECVADNSKTSTDEDERIINQLITLVNSAGEVLLIPTNKEELIAWLNKYKESLHIPETCKENADSFTEDERIRQWLYNLVDEGAYLCERPFATESILSYLEKQKEQKPWKVGANAYFTPEQKPEEVDESTKRLNDNWMKQHFDDYKERTSAESISQLTVQGKGVYKICPRCKSRMIRDDSKVYTSMPPQYGYECPKCGEMEFDTVMYDNPEMEEQKPLTDEEKEYIRTIKSIISDFIRDKKPENLAYYQRIYDWLDGRHVPFSCGHEKGKQAEWAELQSEFRNINEAFEDGKKEVIDHPDKYGLTKQKPVESIEFDNEFEKQVSHLLASVLNGEWEYDEGFVKYSAQSLLGYAKNEMKPDEWDKREKLFRKALQAANARIGQLLEENQKLKEQKPEWSEEDEKMMKDTIDWLTDAYYEDSVEDNISWLKSLPKRFNLQPKQECGKVTINGEPVSAENHSVDIPLAEWSKEDEEIYTFVCNFFETCWWSKTWDISREQVLQMLKSLRPQQKQKM